MAGVLTVLFISALLGMVSFATGMLPLFFTFSRARIAYLSTVGTGLLLGAALGIIIPELLVSSNASDPGMKVALSLLSGFAFMLLVEQLSSGQTHAHKHTHSPLPVTAPLHPFRDSSPDLGGSRTLNGLEEEFIMSSAEAGGVEVVDDAAESQARAGRARALPLTIGLVIHSLADGLALGASALPRSGDREGEGNNNAVLSGPSTQLSFVVLLALIVHKAPTALAFSTSLLSTSLPPTECRKHIAVFSLSTPIGALMTFGVLTLLGAGAGGDWAGIALLVSGGTFLYVATVLQPVSHQESHLPSSPEMSEKVRAGLIVLGMFIPFCISLVSGGHEH
ncbi:Zinc/iron permease [Phellopilus nigrolimitatus]|nr:Zinc/iron permease [Phellopilus nigrolimitatus]